MSSRLLAAARVAAARLAGNCRTIGSFQVKELSPDKFIATIKNDIMHPETRPEHQG